MSTRIDIPDALMRMAQAKAKRDGVEPQAVIERILRESLGKESLIKANQEQDNRFEFKDFSVSGNGLCEGLDWDDFGSIRRLIYEWPEG